MGKSFGFFLSRPVEGRIKIVTIKRDSLGDHYICFVTDLVRKKSKPATRNGCGFDFGLKTFLTTSNGEKIESPLYLKQSLKKLKAASKKLSSKEKGSKSKRRARLVVARLHRKVANQRLDFIFKLTKELVETYDELYFEDLSMKGMQKLWGRKVSDVANGIFMGILEYRCNQYDRKLVRIGRYEPSTSICSECGYKHSGLTLADRSWTCPQCGTFHDRDINAAKVIYQKGRALSLGVGDVRPEFASQTQAVTV
jgi:putative transposase